MLEAVCLEDAGFCKKGEIGDFFDSTDTTYKGSSPSTRTAASFRQGSRAAIRAVFVTLSRRPDKSWERLVSGRSLQTSLPASMAEGA